MTHSGWTGKHSSSGKFTFTFYKNVCLSVGFQNRKKSVRLRPSHSVTYNTIAKYIVYDCSELEGRVMEKKTLNTIRSVLAEDHVEDLSHQQTLAIEDKQKEDEDEASFSDSS